MCDCHPVTGDCYTDCKDFEHLCTLWQWSLITIVTVSWCELSSHVHAHKGRRFSNRYEYLWTMRWLHFHFMLIICHFTHGCLYCYASSHSLSALLGLNAANTVGVLRILSNYVLFTMYLNNTRLMFVLHCYLHLDKTCTSVPWKETIPILVQYVSGYFRDVGCCKLVVWQYDKGVINWMPKRLS